jgi:dTDP-4-dehydrorhamnose 3,5-epimerase
VVQYPKEFTELNFGIRIFPTPRPPRLRGEISESAHDSQLTVMIFTETRLKGAFVIEPEKVEDKRGFFARTWCQHEFANRGLNPCIAQCSISFNLKRGTLRGMHYQVAPYEEAKVVRCISGAIYDVIIDLRPQSPTFTEWLAVELNAENRRMLYVPEGFAHGFQTLEDNTEIFYQISEFYAPEYARGVRWDDSAFGIQWPLADRPISIRDQTFPDFIVSTLTAAGGATNNR